ncbi:SDR family oxidoreductase [Streptomyces sp. TRM S81-3]|uniref:SDR family oxidoreductase n=1 Tax=Streptomyces griseicoloratus TaxID=2752516 RepID=A0A926L9I6_9ACTN|nr:SDR family oxidoreductase [Streptomyces griseicoloratus]MBD0422637.1 SDR family oxidoreductase [Streptomyces griseicoloratus]
MLTAVTGATGFLGLHLVRELLARRRRLLLLARPHPLPAPVRVERFLRTCGADAEELRVARTHLQTREIALEDGFLGLGREGFQRLADRIDVLWHCAGDISFGSSLQQARRTNVDGTRHVLRLLTAGERAPLLCHVSTVAVAGARPDGVVEEKELDASFGFNTPYEQSKFEAEGLVHRWVSEYGGRALVFRPSCLATHRPAHPDRPHHPLQVLARQVGAMLRRHPELTGTPGPMALPVPAGAGTNVLPVEHAAYAMVEAAARHTGDRPRIHHVVNRRNLPMTEVIAALGDHFGVPVDTSWRSSRAPQDMRRTLPAYAYWLSFSRTYEGAGLARLGLACPARPVVDRDYVAAALH